MKVRQYTTVYAADQHLLFRMTTDLMLCGVSFSDLMEWVPNDQTHYIACYEFRSSFGVYNSVYSPGLRINLTESNYIESLNKILK